VKVNDAEVELPARSVATAWTTFAPGDSVATHDNAPPTTVAGEPLHITDMTPDNASVTVPESVTDGVYTVVPVVLVVGEESVMTGGVLSMFMFAEAEPVLPARSATAPVTV
jgi:hypothetical protein